MFSIALFEDGLQLVPTCWLNEDRTSCRWPPVFNQIKLNKMVAAVQPPSDSWADLKVEKVYGSAEDYNKGIDKLKLAMDKTDISSEDSEVEKAKRKIHKKRNFGSEGEEEEDGHLPKYPKVPKKKKSALQKDILNKDMVSTNPPQNEESSINQKPIEESAMKNTNKEQELLAVECDEAENLSERKFRMLTLAKLNNLIARIAVVEENLNAMRRGAVGNCSKASAEIMGKFPIKNIAEIQLFEKFIAEEKNYKALILTLKGIGGSNDQYAIRNILKRILTNEVAELYSWAGAKEKNAFKALRISKAILDTARIHFPSLTEEEFEKTVANWLRHAKQRRERAKGHVQSTVILHE